MRFYASASKFLANFFNWLWLFFAWFSIMLKILAVRKIFHHLWVIYFFLINFSTNSEFIIITDSDQNGDENWQHFSICFLWCHSTCRYENFFYIISIFMTSAPSILQLGNFFIEYFSANNVFFKLPLLHPSIRSKIFLRSSMLPTTSQKIRSNLIRFWRVILSWSK